MTTQNNIIIACVACVCIACVCMRVCMCVCVCACALSTSSWWAYSNTPLAGGLVTVASLSLTAWQRARSVFGCPCKPIPYTYCILQHNIHTQYTHYTLVPDTNAHTHTHTQTYNTHTHTRTHINTQHTHSHIISLTTIKSVHCTSSPRGPPCVC